MHKGVMETLLNSSYLANTNHSYMEQLYEDFLENPQNVDVSWHEIFKQLLNIRVVCDQSRQKLQEPIYHHLNKDNESHVSSEEDIHNIYCKQLNILNLIDAFRAYGHQNANLNPLKLWKQEPVPNLNPTFHDITEIDFHKIVNVGSFCSTYQSMKLADLYAILTRTYCSSIGIEYMHIFNVEQIMWIQKQIESVAGQFNFTSKEKRRLLNELTAAEGLERYLGIKFPGAKRFSLEGADVLIPMLKEIVRYAGKHSIREIVLGMAHRGRLNVLVNIFGKHSQDLFDEFSGKYKEHLGTGDVKYHQGFSSNIEIDGELVHLSLAFNPSHLEIINPVVMGSARARIDRLGEQSSRVLPITLHGDAAISGQGIMQETLNMSKVRAYDVGGTVRIVINNQIGFTSSNSQDARSSWYCTDIAKMVRAPIFHVNADDPEAVIFITRVALDFRHTFKSDVIIDLICYRRHGHNEADEPSATQPLMYQKIKIHPTIRKIYADHLENNNIITPSESTKMVTVFRDMLDNGSCLVTERRLINLPRSNIWKDYLSGDWDEEYQNLINHKDLQNLARRISNIPDEIEMQPQVKKIYNDRIAMSQGDKSFDWGAAEMLAYATLVNVGIPVRLSGEDTARGTFFHRHAVIHNQKNGSTYTPLEHVHINQGNFKVWDSILSEEAVLAFEYGYATAEPHALVIWEAQFGDFSNVAQVVIDQFITSGEQKWGRMCGLVMLLPHGYEGQGPEHSSARLERYLQLCAEKNIQICIPSTPSQIYHMLRRQALRKMRRPLIVFSPKSLLRHPMAISSLEELANGTFQSSIGEIDNLDPKDVKRVIICSGKIYYDLLDQRRKNKLYNISIVRIEQLYPFPQKVIKTVLAPYAHVRDFVWCQEEPKNQGAWNYNYHRFREIISTDVPLHYIGRPATASPAVGCLSLHQIQQKKLINDALNINLVI
ncbi:2-oxoglutarate dehydrogenase E1 component [Candidatus Curculioniphilus buchneri]|uniref:2-oxoglutarate dehydrogenase E1 component n=1 Tax=Candidatus Curculioniphilus buchneri TaxID=690594 RepID=UPI00376EE711